MNAYDRLQSSFPALSVVGCLEAIVRADHPPSEAERAWSHPSTQESLEDADPPLWRIRSLKDTELPPLNSKGQFVDLRQARIPRKGFDCFVSASLDGTLPS
jgi:hypothetical protein